MRSSLKRVTGRERRGGFSRRLLASKITRRRISRKGKGKEKIKVVFFCWHGAGGSGNLLETFRPFLEIKGIQKKFALNSISLRHLEVPDLRKKVLKKIKETNVLMCALGGHKEIIDKMAEKDKQLAGLLEKKPIICVDSLEFDATGQIIYDKIKEALKGKRMKKL